MCPLTPRVRGHLQVVVATPLGEQQPREVEPADRAGDDAHRQPGGEDPLRPEITRHQQERPHQRGRRQRRCRGAGQPPGDLWGGERQERDRARDGDAHREGREGDAHREQHQPRPLGPHAERPRLVVAQFQQRQPVCEGQRDRPQHGQCDPRDRDVRPFASVAPADQPGLRDGRAAEGVQRLRDPVAGLGPHRRRVLGKTTGAERLVSDVEAEFTVYGSEDPRTRVLTSLGFVPPADLDQVIGTKFGTAISAERTDLLDVRALVWLSSAGTRATLDADKLYSGLDVAKRKREVFIPDDSEFGSVR